MSCPSVQHYLRLQPGLEPGPIPLTFNILHRPLPHQLNRELHVWRMDIPNMSIAVNYILDVGNHSMFGLKVVCLSRCQSCVARKKTSSRKMPARNTGGEKLAKGASRHQDFTWPLRAIYGVAQQTKWKRNYSYCLNVCQHCRFSLLVLLPLCIVSLTILVLEQSACIVSTANKRSDTKNTTT